MKENTRSLIFCPVSLNKYAGSLKSSLLLTVLSRMRGLIRTLPLRLTKSWPCSIFALVALVSAVFLFTPAIEAKDSDVQVNMPGIVSGHTMGTVYRVVLPGTGEEKLAQIRIRIQDLLEEINRELSVFDPESQVSLFNRMPAGERLCVSAGFQEVMRIALKVHSLSHGAFDPTAAPLIDLWGFGEKGFYGQKPEPQEIAAALELVGLDGVHLDESGCLSKEKDGIRLNLSAVAKGFAVDELAGILEDMGQKYFLVSIGGDMRARGPKPDGSNWQIGVNRPHPGAGLKDTVKKIEITSGAVATSGSYRNFFRSEDKIFSHIIDPSTGYPAHEGTVSATVLADSCILADALATALTVMDSTRGMEIINSLEDIEALIIQMTPDGEYILHKSEGF